MSKSIIFNLIKEILLITLIAMLGCVGVVFSVLYIDTFNFLNSNLITSLIVSIIAVLTVLTIVFLRYNKLVIYKLFFLLVFSISFSLISLYVLKVTGFLEKFDSVDKFREFVQSFGAYTIIIFVLIQFLQVVILPIPSFVTVGAGVLLFGAFWGSVYSCLGIISGSIVAYFIGKIFGVKVAKWLIGEASLCRGLKLISGKDRIVLTFMFLFPFFPDDLLCFVAGITTVSPAFFIVMIIITRVVSVFITSLSKNKSIIPYYTWWGILLWICFFVITIVLTVIIYKYGDVFERKILKRTKSK